MVAVLSLPKVPGEVLAGAHSRRLIQLPVGSSIRCRMGSECLVGSSSVEAQCCACWREGTVNVDRWPDDYADPVPKRKRNLEFRSIEAREGDHRCEQGIRGRIGGVARAALLTLPYRTADLGAGFGAPFLWAASGESARDVSVDRTARPPEPRRCLRGASSCLGVAALRREWRDDAFGRDNTVLNGKGGPRGPPLSWSLASAYCLAGWMAETFHGPPWSRRNVHSSVTSCGLSRSPSRTRPVVRSSVTSLRA